MERGKVLWDSSVLTGRGSTH